MSNTSLQALTMHPWVYVLRCAPREGTNYPSLYVGASLNVHQRVTQHLVGRGARFTQTHAPSVWNYRRAELIKFGWAQINQVALVISGPFLVISDAPLGEFKMGFL